MRFLLGLGLLLCLAPACYADEATQCMARFGNEWVTWVPGSAIGMTESTCPAQIIYHENGTEQIYQLRTGPIRGPAQVTCTWSWAADHTGGVLPPPGAPGSIVCNLFPQPVTLIP